MAVGQALQVYGLKGPIANEFAPTGLVQGSHITLVLLVF